MTKLLLLKFFWNYMLLSRKYSTNYLYMHGIFTNFNWNIADVLNIQYIYIFENKLKFSEWIYYNRHTVL